MNNEVIHFNYDAAFPSAKEDFIRSCGLNRENPCYDELFDEAMMVLRNGRESIDLAAITTQLNRDAFLGNAICLKDSVFKCTAFEQIPLDNIINLYAYILTAGVCSYRKENLMEQYYADLWGNAFLKSARDLLRSHVAREVSELYPHAHLSFSFGPGFYGMRGDRFVDMVNIMDASLIGVRMDEDGVITPSKSSGGFFMAVNDETMLPDILCKNCIGREEGCLFCGGNNLIPEKVKCMALLDQYETPQHVVKHCLKVCEVALIIGKALQEKGFCLNLDLLEAAALLHDIARTSENHGARGSEIALKHGYSEVARLIKCHMFYVTDPNKERITEQDILCLSDRMVKEDEFVGLDIRMQSVLDKYQNDPFIANRIKQRMQENKLLYKRIEEIIGTTIHELLKD